MLRAPAGDKRNTRRQGTRLTVDSGVAFGGHADTDVRQDWLVPLQFAHAGFINLDCLELAGGEVLFHVVRAAAQKQKREDADCVVHASTLVGGADRSRRAQNRVKNDTEECIEPINDEVAL
jgi:hypothetical protein